MLTQTFFILCTECAHKVVSLHKKHQCIGAGWPMGMVKKKKHDENGIKEERWLRGCEEGIC
jgi:hypothetical protein